MSITHPFSVFQEHKSARHPAGSEIRRKKRPNLFRLCGFAIRSKGVCFSFYWGIANPPGLLGRTFFDGGLQIRRDA